MNLKKYLIFLVCIFILPLTAKAESKYLYDVLKEEAETGGLAREYTREHQDTVDNSGTEKIYYLHASNNNEAIEIKNKNNVLFGGFCWQIYRTTDSGGVKILYNGQPYDGKCEGYYATIGKSKYTIFENIYNIASAGYMYNDLLNKWDLINLNYNNLPYFGNSITYANGVYTLVDTIRVNKNDNISNNHYFCEDGSQTCSKVYYAISTSSDTTLYGIKLENGMDIGQHLTKSLYSEDVNRNNSALKNTIDTWYEHNMTKYTKFLEDTVFCQNRNFAFENNILNPNNGDKSMQFYRNYSSGETGEVESDNYYYNTNLKCDNETDRFSTLNEKAKLTYPVASINLAEALLINNYFDSGSSGQIVREHNGSEQYSSYWLLSPNSTGIQTYGWAVGYGGSIFYSYGASENDVRPMVSLKKGIEYSSGDGSKNDPYVINYTHSVSVDEASKTKEFNVEVDNLTQIEYEEVVKFRVIPKEGYEVDYIEIKDENNNQIEYRPTNTENEYEFTMPYTDVTISPVYRKKGIINPNTGNMLILSTILNLIILGLGTYEYRRKESKK